MLLTRAPGYVLEVAPGRLDLRRFEELAPRAARLLDEGRAADAARTLRAALEELARAAPRRPRGRGVRAGAPPGRLEEARLETLESRNDAELALGRHGELVGELRTLVRRHPLRERLRAQLMLALYRSGRQAEALEVYRARRTLVDELGLEPGPELQQLQQAILAQDPELELPRSARGHRPSARASRARRRRRRRGRRVAAIVTLALAGGEDGGSARAPIDAGHAVALNAASGEIERRIAAGRTPSAIAAQRRRRLAGRADARTVLRVEPRPGSSRRSPPAGRRPTSRSATDRSGWRTRTPRPGHQFVGPVPVSVARLDGVTRTSRAEIDLPQGAGPVSNRAAGLAVPDGAVWAVTADGRVVRIEAATGVITATSRGLRAASVAAGPAGVWALGFDGEVARLDERTARPLVRTRVPASPLGSIAVGEDAAWVTSPTGRDALARRRRRAPRRWAQSRSRAGDHRDVAQPGRTAVWVVDPVLGTVTQVDASDGSVTRTLEVDGIPRAVALDGDSLWVAVAPVPRVGARRRGRGGPRRCRRNVCEPVIAGAERRGRSSCSSPTCRSRAGRGSPTTQMAQAIAFVLREHGFRAGRFRVAYQSCDDSDRHAPASSTRSKCASNARALRARTREVVARDRHVQLAVRGGRAPGAEPGAGRAARRWCRRPTRSSA